jgi:hypothetical protein
MRKIYSIGSLSNNVIPHGDSLSLKNGIKRKLSELLREEKERLFAEVTKKRDYKIKLPKAKRSWHGRIGEVPSDLIIPVAISVLEKFHKDGYAKDIKTFDDLMLNENKYWRFVNVYILLQCYQFNHKSLSKAFQMSKDVSKNANRSLLQNFLSQKQSKEYFLEVFDYYMTLTRREYS